MRGCLMFPKCHIFFLFSRLEYVRLTTRDSRQVHIFILSLNNYCWRTLVFLMDPGLKIRMMWCLSFSCSSFVLHQWDFFDPRIRCSCSLHSLLLNMNITLHPLSLTVSPCLSSHSELPSLSPPHYLICLKVQVAAYRWTISTCPESEP